MSTNSEGRYYKIFPFTQAQNRINKTLIEEILKHQYSEI